VKQVILNVPDISCEHCERTITNVLTPVAGVRTVQVDIPAKQVHVQYDESAVGVDQMKEILQDEDYPVESATIG
jgi:copper chaperone